jgi:predicted metal-dependent peptidase
VTGQYDHKLSNVAQDMIINHIIWEDINHSFVEIPKDKNGKNMALFVPKEYTGKLIFEELYEWLKEEKEKHQKNKQKSQCQSCGGSGDKQDGKGKGKDKSDKSGQSGQGDGQGEGQGNGEQCPDCNGSGQKDGGKGQGKPKYGPYGKNPSKDGDSIDTWSTEQILDDLENGTGEYLDKHIGDEIPEEMREAMVRDVMEKLAARGLSAGNVETTLNKLRKKRKDYLKEIKRAVSNMIFGTVKQATIVKPNRKQISGLKGKRKVKTAINVILDTSGSMGNTFEKVLSYIYRNDIEVNMIQADTQVNWVEKFMNQKKIDRMKISGLGGTCLQPAVDYVVENLNEYNTCILSDGYCDNLCLDKLKGKVLIISIGVKVPIAKSNGKVKQICVDIGDK